MALLRKGLVSFSGNCDFESGMCAYVNTQAEDQFDWLRNAGNTPSWLTGPKVDHTLGTALGNLKCYIKQKILQTLLKRAE